MRVREVPAFPGDTIAAVATPPGEGAIGIVRLSGPEAIRCAQAVFRGRRALAELPSHTLTRGAVVGSGGEIIDDVLVSVMQAPHTYTGEDVVEINCHGGILVVETVLQRLLEAGARPARRGEFTQRAFLNGKLDLAQAEAVIDIVRARSPKGLALAARQLEGELSRRVSAVRERILHLLGRLQVVIDYPEEDLSELSDAEAAAELAALEAEVNALLAGADAGKVYRDGVRLAIVGRPNVGKSSLLNALLRDERAIVTEIAGTTRDTIDASAVIRDIPLTLVDTAGLRETEDPVERIGVARTRAAIETADIVLVVVDGSQALAREDDEVFAALRASGREDDLIVVVNKADLPPVVTDEELHARAPGRPLVRVSAKSGLGLEALEERVAQAALGGSGAQGGEILVAKARHRQALEEARMLLQSAREGLAAGMTADVITLDLQGALGVLGSITGDQVAEEIVAHIFAEFCVGK